jgi:hypothetical protein
MVEGDGKVLLRLRDRLSIYIVHVGFRMIY